MKNRPMLTLDDCRKISAAAEAEATKNKWIVCIAILDDGGHPLHLVRQDGATPAVWSDDVAAMRARVMNWTYLGFAISASQARSTSTCSATFVLSGSLAGV